MSFRTAYSSFKRGQNSRRLLAPFRDPTPEEWKHIMDEYYKQQQRKK